MHERRRQQLVEWLVAGVVGAVLLLLSDLLVAPPAVVPAGHPARFVGMVASPLAFTSEIPQRVLWPLLAHAAGWFGVGPIVFSQACCAALLAVVFWFCRRRGAAWLDAGLIAAAVAASGAVLVQKPLPCMSDPLNLLLLVLTVHFVARPLVFWGLVLLAAASHEMVLFFAPWLLWLRVHEGGGSLWRDGARLVVVIGVYAGWRVLVNALAPGGYDATYYTSNNFWAPWLLPAVWSLWLVVLLAEFGPLLVVAVAAWWRGEHGLGGRLGPWLYWACVLSLMVFAYDVFRFAAFAFLPVVLGGIALTRRPAGRAAFAGLLLAAIVTYAWEHPVPSQQGGATFTRIYGPMFGLATQRVQPGPTPGSVRAMAFGDAMFVQRESLAMFAGTWLLVFAAVVATAGLGVWLARHVGTARDPGLDGGAADTAR